MSNLIVSIFRIGPLTLVQKRKSYGRKTKPKNFSSCFSLKYGFKNFIFKDFINIPFLQKDYREVFEATF